MHLCYVDEAGCPGRLPSPTSQVQPVLTIAALWFPQTALHAITHGFLQLKANFNPRLAAASPHYLDIARKEIKGSDLRKSIRDGDRNRRRGAFGFIDKTLDLLERNGATFVTRVYIKQPGGLFDGKAVYTSSMQSICSPRANVT